jgi:3-hydroxypropanoate dehydrogenase
MQQQHLSTAALAQIFVEARTHHHWQKKDVSAEVLQSIYDLAKWGPTSMNSSPMRVVFIKSEEQKAKLLPALMGANGDQVKAAPVTAIVAHDIQFFEHLPKLFPAYDAKPMFVANPGLADLTAFRNGTLQGAYLMLATRSVGLDVGAMSGFDNAKVDEAFFKGTSVRSNFLFNLGYGDAEKLFPRGPRLSFDQACKII